MKEIYPKNDIVTPERLEIMERLFMRRVRGLAREIDKRKGNM